MTQILKIADLELESIINSMIYALYKLETLSRSVACFVVFKLFKINYPTEYALWLHFL